MELHSYSRNLMFVERRSFSLSPSKTASLDEENKKTSVKNSLQYDIELVEANKIL